MPVCRHHSACPPGPCSSGGGPVGLPNLMKLGEKEEDVEEKKEDDDDEEEMEGKRMYEKDLQDRLMV